MRLVVFVVLMAALISVYRVPDLDIAPASELRTACAAGHVFAATEPELYYEGMPQLKSLCSPLLIEHQGMVFSVQDCGEESGEAVVLLHGFPDVWTSWERQIIALAGAGYRVIVPSMRGYEASSTAVGDYHLTSLAQDVACHLSALHIGEAHIIGHDWGSSVAEVVSTQYRGLAKSVAGLAVPFKYPKYSKPNAAQLSRSWYIFFFQLPFLPEFVTSRNDFAFLEKLYRDWSPTYNWSSEAGQRHLRELKAAFRQPGVVSATIGYYRHNIPQLMAAGPFYKLTDPAGWLDHPTFGRVDCPVLMISGADDGCIGTQLFDSTPLDAGDFTAGAKFVRIEGAGHFVQFEQPQVVNDALISWLRSL